MPAALRDELAKLIPNPALLEALERLWRDYEGWRHTAQQTPSVGEMKAAAKAIQADALRLAERLSKRAGGLGAWLLVGTLPEDLRRLADACERVDRLRSRSPRVALAMALAERFRAAGETPTTYEEGTYARVLELILNHADGQAGDVRRLLKYAKG